MPTTAMVGKGGRRLPFPARIADTSANLESRGLVEHNAERGKYQLGYGVAQLAASAAKKYELSLLSRPVTGALADRVGETVNVAIHDGRSVITIDQVIVFGLHVAGHRPRALRGGGHGCAGIGGIARRMARRVRLASVV